MFDEDDDYPESGMEEDFGPAPAQPSTPHAPDDQLYDWLMQNTQSETGPGGQSSNSFSGLTDEDISGLAKGESWWKSLLKGLVMGNGNPNQSPLGATLGAASASAQKQNNTADVLRANAEDAALSRDKFAASVPATRMNTGMRAALGKAARPASVSWGGPGSGLRGEIPKFSGGILSTFDALKDPSVSSLLDTILQDSLVAQRRGGASGGNMDATSTAPPPGQTSLGDDILGGVSLGATTLEALYRSGLLDRLLGPSQTTTGASRPTTGAA